jgi:ribonuclease J
MMARDGMFTIIIIVDSKAGKIIGEPDIISRGFIYLRESKGLLEETKKEVAKIVAPKLSPEYSANWNYVKSTIRDRIGEFLFKKTQRRPMVLPVIIEV